MNTEKIITWLGIVVIPIVLFVLTPAWSSFFSDKKSIEYSVVAKSSIGGMAFDKQDWPQIKILFENKKIENGAFLTLMIANTGKLPIKVDDFDSPIVLKTDKPANIIAHRIANKFPDNLSVKVSITDQGVQIKPLLMNAGDRFAIELFAAEDFDIETVSARIIGVDSIKKMDQEELSGIYVNKVRSNGPGRTLETRLFHIYPIVSAFGFVALLALTLAIVHLRWLTVSGSVKALIFILAMTSEIAAAFSGAVMLIALEDYDLATWVQVSVFVISILVAIGVALPITKAIRNVRDKLQVTPDKPA